MAQATGDYITNADIQQRVGAAAYVQLADDDGDGIADEPVVDEVRLAALGEVNAYLARRFAVPVDLTTHPELADVLRSVSLDLAEHRLRDRRPPVPEASTRRLEATRRWLEGVATGSIELPSLTPLAPNTARGTVAKASGETRVLSREELNDF